MIIYDDGITFVMTLLIAVHNGVDFVIASDTLVKRILADGTTYYETGSKIFPMNSSTALMTSGAYDSAMRQFIQDYAYNNSESTDLGALRAGVMTHATFPKLSEGHYVQFCFVGFTNGIPDMKRVKFEHNREPEPNELNGNDIFTSGMDGPSNRAKVLLRDAAKEISGPETSNIRRMVKTVLLKCIREFKNSDDERLGGAPDIRVLHQR